MAATLTNANSVVSITTEILYPQAQRLQGYATDDAFESGTVENGEFLMGIDGIFSAGFVYNAVELTITLQADSPSIPIFENIYQYEQSNRTKLQQDLTVTTLATSRRYDYKQGYVVSYKAPAGKKILQPAVIVLQFARLQPSPV